MGRVAITALKPGMILDSGVYNHHRQCLAKAGAVIDEREIRVFQTWGVVEVDVQGEETPSLEEINTRMAASPVLQQLSDKIDDRFYGASDHPILLELKRVIKHSAIEDQKHA